MTIRPPITHWLTGARLLEIRQIARLSQLEMARALGYAQSYYAAMETGGRRIPAELANSVKSKVIRFIRERQARDETAIESISCLS